MKSSNSIGYLTEVPNANRNPVELCKTNMASSRSPIRGEFMLMKHCTVSTNRTRPTTSLDQQDLKWLIADRIRTWIRYDKAVNESALKS